MTRPDGRLTAQEQQFITLVVEEGLSFAGAYRLVYPPRNGTRSAGAERVAAKRVAHRPLVQQRMEELREELLASDPVKMRRRAVAVLGRILAKRQDPRYRRTALDVLKYLDERERVALRAEREEYRALLARLAALKAAEAAAKTWGPSLSARPHLKTGTPDAAIVDPAEERTKRPPTSENAEDAARRKAEIQQVIEERRRMRKAENLKFPAPLVMNARSDDPPRTAEEDAAVKVKEDGFRLVRKAGHFGKGVWMRVPVARSVPSSKSRKAMGDATSTGCGTVVSLFNQ
jgi:hypothetical protein